MNRAIPFTPDCRVNVLVPKYKHLNTGAMKVVGTGKFLGFTKTGLCRVKIEHGKNAGKTKIFPNRNVVNAYGL